MSSKNKEKRTLNFREKEEFDFDFQKEKNIYMYLWRKHTLNRRNKTVDESDKFGKYEEWKKYIQTKYSSYNKEKLEEFSRLLNQKTRNLEPDQVYWNIFIPILCALIVDKFFEQIVMQQLDFSTWYELVAQIILTLIIVIFVTIILLKTVMPIWDHNIEKGFLEDYKEIIDQMIKQKILKKKASNRTLLVSNRTVHKSYSANMCNYIINQEQCR